MAATTLPKTQTAFAITTVGSPLTKIEIPVPEPKGDELLVRLTATGVAPFDQKLRDYGPFDIGSRLPVIVTYDAVGVVEKYSDELSQELKTKFPLGSHVFAQPSIFNPLSGGLQQYTTIAAPFTSIVPSSISDVEAALYPINGITSFAALFSTEGGPEGKNRGLGIPFPGTPGSESFDYKNTTIMILGGGSRCGKLAIQFAKLAGIGGILTTSSKSSFDEMKKLGATHVFDRRSENLVEEVRKVTGDELVYVYDTMSRESELDLGAKLLSDNKKGYFSHLLNGKISEDVLAQKKGGVQDWHMMGSSAWHPKLSAVFWENIGSWIDNGLTGGEYKVLEGPLNKEGVLEGVNKVLDAYRDGGFQRVHVKISE